MLGPGGSEISSERGRKVRRSLATAGLGSGEAARCSWALREAWYEPGLQRGCSPVRPATGRGPPRLARDRKKPPFFVLPPHFIIPVVFIKNSFTSQAVPCAGIMPRMGSLPLSIPWTAQFCSGVLGWGWGNVLPLSKY